MSLRNRMLITLSIGAVVFVAVTALLRGRLESDRVEHVGRMASELSGESVGFELSRQGEEIARRLEDWVNDAVQSTGQNVHQAQRTPRAFWSQLLEVAKLDGRETLAMVTANGELLAADGAWAAQRGNFTQLVASRSLVGRTGRPGLRKGIIAGGDRPIIAASLGIDPQVTGTSIETGGISSVGPRVVLVRNLMLQELGTRWSIVDVELYDLAQGTPPEDLPGLLLVELDGDDALTIETDGGFASVQGMSDPSGRAGYLLISRTVAAEKAAIVATIRDSMIWEGLVAFFLIALGLRFLSKEVEQPLRGLERQAQRLARSEHGTLAFHSSEWGEFRRLADSLDVMLDKIQEDRSEYVRSARIAGMSDVSMAVVHNAGNVLNSINVSTQFVANEISNLGVNDMRSMVAELEEHKEDLVTYVTEDPNGKFMIPFLAAMTEALEDLRTRCLVELESVDSGIEHVVDLIRSQERYAIGASVIEEAQIPNVLNMALNIAALSNTRSNLIRVERSYAKLDAVRVDRHKLTSILINVLSNAIEALVPEEVENRRLELSVYSMTKDRFVIEVTDTGVGIAPENLDKIFNSNFTTKMSSSGHGLHTTANLCNEMGIAIGAVSEGPGCGTTIKLRVPHDPPEESTPETALEAAGAALPSGPPSPGAASNAFPD